MKIIAHTEDSDGNITHREEEKENNHISISYGVVSGAIVLASLVLNLFVAAKLHNPPPCIYPSIPTINEQR